MFAAYQMRLIRKKKGKKRKEEKERKGEKGKGEILVPQYHFLLVEWIFLLRTLLEMR